MSGALSQRDEKEKDLDKVQRETANCQRAFGVCCGFCLCVCFLGNYFEINKLN